MPRAQPSPAPLTSAESEWCEFDRWQNDPDRERGAYFYSGDPAIGWCRAPSAPTSDLSDTIGAAVAKALKGSATGRVVPSKRDAEPVQLGPLLVTQANCLAVAGLEPRKFLQLIHELGLEVFELGKTRAVHADELLSSIKRKPRGASQSDVETQAERLARAAGLA